MVLLWEDRGAHVNGVRRVLPLLRAAGRGVGEGAQETGGGGVRREADEGQVVVIASEAAVIAADQVGLGRAPFLRDEALLRQIEGQYDPSTYKRLPVLRVYRKTDLILPRSSLVVLAGRADVERELRTGAELAVGQVDLGIDRRGIAGHAWRAPTAVVIAVDDDLSVAAGLCPQYAGLTLLDPARGEEADVGLTEGAPDNRRGCAGG
jgi:hypothetical protein